MQARPDTRLRSGADAPYDLEVVDEAIVNAVAHRDYAISGSKIHLLLFGDRLELYSPGKLPDTITLEEMPYRTFIHNQFLVELPVENPQQANRGRCSWNPAANACGRSSRTARPIRGGGRRTICSATSFG